MSLRGGEGSEILCNPRPFVKETQILKIEAKFPQLAEFMRIINLLFESKNNRKIYSTFIDLYACKNLRNILL